MNAEDLGKLVGMMASCARSRGEARAETTLPDGTVVEVVLRARPTGLMRRLMEKLAGQKPGLN